MRREGFWLSIGLLVAAMVSIQVSAAYGKTLFPRVGAAGVAGLRIAFAALIMAGATRPWRALKDRKGYGWLIAYGLVLGAMNLIYYLSLARLPLGIAVALEFVGPLGVALWASRKPRDFLWIGLAVAGLAVLLPLRRASAGVDPLGAALALTAGGLWAAYILIGKRAGDRFGGAAAGLGMMMAAVAIAPIGLVTGGPRLFLPGVLPAAFVLALLSSAIPYSLEMYALTRLPSRLFGLLMSLEPAIASVSGALVLGERLTILQAAGVAAIVAASFGASLGA